MKLSNALSILSIGAVAAMPQGQSASSATATSATMTSMTSTSASASVNPCAALSMSSKSFMSQNPKATSVEFQPSVVLACQQDIPINNTLAKASVEWIQSFLQFQSTLAYLKNPPSTYPLPPVDLLGGLTTIGQKAASGQYANEFDFEYDLYSLLQSAFDGHLSYIPYVQGAFTYSRTDSLVSISSDGIQLPKVYFLSDVGIVQTQGNKTSPSAVVSINGQDATQFLQQDAKLQGGFQDLNAQFNYLFSNPATAIGSPSKALGSFVSDPDKNHSDTTTYTFENGSSRTIPNTATVGVNLTFDSGESFFQKHLAPSPSSATAKSSASSSSSSATASSSSSPQPTVPGYPYPIVKHSLNSISGYFLNGSDTSDVAVLSIINFLDNATPSQLIEFSNDIKQFLAMSKSAGKTRLIVDVRGNPGGTSLLAYEAFKQLFPTITPYSGVRIRLSEAANAMGQEISKLGNFDLNNATDVADGAVEGSTFQVKTLLTDPDGANFSGWAEYAGPVHANGDNFTEIGAINLGDTSIDLAALGFVISGYGNNTNLPPQVFATENVTLFTDGQCSSTCGIFANLVISQKGIKTVAAGGLPNNDTMAIIGGVQGAQVAGFVDIDTYAVKAMGIARNTTGNSTETDTVKNLLEPLDANPPLPFFGGPSAPTLNLRDNIAANDSTMTPLQFSGGVPADCRFFYVAQDILNVTNSWVRVANGIQAGGKGFCINGTIGSFSTPVANSSSSTPSGPNSSKTSAPKSSAAGIEVRWSVFVLTLLTFVFAL